MWQTNITHAKNAVVGAVDGKLYISMVNGNAYNNPTTDSGTYWQPTGGLLPWTPTFDAPTCGITCPRAALRG
jgi:hypothetical protein